MAIYHFSTKAISRSAGRSATAAAAYRSGLEITDERTGKVHDYSRKQGVEFCDLLLPENAPEWASDRSALWNAAEQAETRINSTVAREFEIGLPSELNAEQRRELALTLGREIVERHQCAVDISIHAPGSEGDHRNHHAHILLSTRRLGHEGFTEKTRELDQKQSGEIVRWRERFAELQNGQFQALGIEQHVDHRSYKDQGIEREPTQHLGAEATALERQGIATDIGDANRAIQLAYEQGLEQRLELAQTNEQIIDTSTSLEEALKERDQYRHGLETLEAGAKEMEERLEKLYHELVLENALCNEKDGQELILAPPSDSLSFDAWFEQMESEQKQHLELDHAPEKDDNDNKKGKDYGLDMWDD
jgi:MobA/MobL family